MDEVELRALVTAALDRPGDLEPWSERSGTVLYSDAAAVRPSSVYLLGINPGGQEDLDHKMAIVRNIAARQGTNSYADQCWGATCAAPYACTHCHDGRLRPECRSVIQQRVCSLFEMLGSSPAEVPSTNLIFARSSELATLGGKALWKRRCRDVHLALLSIVRPRWVVTLGFGEAYSSLRAFGKETRPQKAILQDGKEIAWHRRIALKLQDGDILEVGVLGVAHPGHRGFGRAGLAGSLAYPAALQTFISEHIAA